MSRRGLSYEELLKELEDLPQYESDCELPSNNNSTDEDSDFVIDVQESQKSSSHSDETTPPLSTLTRRNSNTDIARRPTKQTEYNINRNQSRSSSNELECCQGGNSGLKFRISEKAGIEAARLMLTVTDN
ncbi:hypothetical protein FQA39_LY13723 [Lamprigera yunnana]|nr:hypothetical protein FQA39_LY13723 [Lamprigera yunnana]